MHKSVFCIISCILPHGMLLAQQSSHINFNGSMYSPDAGFYEIDSTAMSYYQNNPDTAEGADLGATAMGILRNVEEHELYLYELHETIEQLQEQVLLLQRELEELKTQKQ